MLTLYDAPRCPYCARTRIVLAEKGVPYETVTIDLANRPSWLLEHNPPDGRVPVLEDDGWVLSESSVIDEYLDERYPEPALMPVDPGERAVARFFVFRLTTSAARTTHSAAARPERPSGLPTRSPIWTTRWPRCRS